MTEDFLPVGTEVIVPLSGEPIRRGIIIDVDEDDPIWTYLVEETGNNADDGYYRCWVGRDDLVIIR